MLVPMILRDFINLDGDNKRIRAVTPSEYLRFINATKWRSSTGYGRHPSRSTDTKNVPASTFHFEYNEVISVHRDNTHGQDVSSIACAVSWYDAAAFALWRGVELPTSQYLAKIQPRGSHLLWCSNWFNEDIAHIAIYDMKSGEIHGLNPDVRLPRTALCVTELQ